MTFRIKGIFFSFQKYSFCHVTQKLYRGLTNQNCSFKMNSYWTLYSRIPLVKLTINLRMDLSKSFPVFNKQSSLSLRSLFMLLMEMRGSF